MAKVVILDLADNEARNAALTMALSMYLGERCKYCGYHYQALTDLEERSVVFAGYHEHGRLACKSCWNANNPEAA
jgi:hypothetical protein